MLSIRHTFIGISLTSLIVVLTLTGCTSLYFKEPVPKNAPVTKALELTPGLYVAERNYFHNTSLLVSIQKLGNGYYSILTFSDIKKDDAIAKDIEDKEINTIDVLSLTKHDIFIETFENAKASKNNVYKFNNRSYALYRNLYDDEGENVGFNGLINLNEEWYRPYGTFGVSSQRKLVVKNYLGRYYLNFWSPPLSGLDAPDCYYLCILDFNSGGIQLKYSTLTQRDFFVLGNTISPKELYQDNIRSFDNKSDTLLGNLLSTIPDKELIELFDNFELNFFITDTITELDNDPSLGLIIVKAIFILLGASMLMKLRKSVVEHRRKIEPYEEKYGHYIGDFPVNKYKQPLNLAPLFGIVIIAFIVVLAIYFPNKWQLVFGQSLLDLDPWSEPKTLLSWQNASILLVPVAWMLLVNFEIILDEKIVELRRHDTLYTGCIKAEREFLVSANSFGVNAELKANNQSNTYDSILETVKFRYKHLAALVSMSSEGWAGFKHFAQLDYAYRNAKESYDALVSKLTEYRNTFGTFRRYG